LCDFRPELFRAVVVLDLDFDFDRAELFVLCRLDRGWLLIFTPERLASERPMAIACLRLFALPVPRFFFSICSRTYSPA
jgi:hypothetical protein